MSLTGPLGSNYQYSCCEKEVNVTSILNSNHQIQNGCEQQVHQASETFLLDASKEKKITDRIIAHQLIILENTGNKYIEKITIREFNQPKTAAEKAESTIKLSEVNSPPSTLVRPSSLNYKISLSEAVLDFIKKDMPLADDQFIDVHNEDPKFNGTTGNNSATLNKTNETVEELDDVMFDLTAPIKSEGRGALNSKANKTNPP
jgi:hypothetical protein